VDESELEMASDREGDLNGWVTSSKNERKKPAVSRCFVYSIAVAECVNGGYSIVSGGCHKGHAVIW